MSLVPQVNFFRFRREELLLCALTRLAHCFTHTVMADMVVGGDSARWGRGHNFMMECLDKTFINLVNINSLNIWVHHFPSFAESMRRKHCLHWDQEEDADGNTMPDAENICQYEGAFNTCGLMDVTEHAITR